MCNISISIYPNENQPSLLSHALPSSAQRQQPYNHPESRNHPDPGASRDRSRARSRGGSRGTDGEEEAAVVRPPQEAAVAAVAAAARPRAADAQ